MFLPPEKYIPLANCKDGGLYRIYSRNLAYGVFRESTQGFIGIRDKFGHVYLFEEYHWDTGEPFGTVMPIELLEMCQITPIDESNNVLFKWLESKGKEYATSDE